MANQPKRYNIILVDVPWKYDNQKNNDPAMGGITYETMDLDAIKNLPVEYVAAKHCALFFWVTMPKLKEGLEVIEAWGFDYRTCAFVWIKTRGGSYYSGLGHWTNQNAELCLFAKRGAPLRQATDVKQLCVAPVASHSEKPPEIHDRIVQLMGDLPRVELFARERVDGWDCLGRAITGNDMMEDLLSAC